MTFKQGFVKTEIWRQIHQGLSNPRGWLLIEYRCDYYSPVNPSPKSPNLDKIATETLFIGNDSHTHPEQHIKNIDDRM